MLPFPGRRAPVLLELDLTTPPAVGDADDPVARLQARGRRQLRPTLRALHEAADDRRVAGLIAKIGGLDWATTQELRLGVQAFAASGKPTVAWAESFDGSGHDLAAYVLATAFAEVWLQPTGTVGALGVGIETTFLRGAFDKLGVEPQLEQRYEYKSAADRLMRTEFTAAHRESVEQLAASVFDDAVAAIAAGRDLAPDRVRELVDDPPRTAAEARDAGLVDRLGYRDEVYDALRARVGEEAKLLFADRWRPGPKLKLPDRQRKHIALVTVRGAIATGRSRVGASGRQAGSDTVSAELRAAGSEDRVQAVVLRVESPGGSVVASDTIWREIGRLRSDGKPVVVSMGELAASGGYYISCGANAIVALPATLTGSIGVLGGKFVVQDLLDRVGVTTGTVQRGARALMYSPRRAFSDEDRERLAAVIDGIYDDFVGKVAAGRGRPVADIEAIARGRVWTGRDALEVGLVDHLGGLRDAVQLARRLADMPPDAPLVRALHVPPLARLGQAKNSEDPRALVGGWPGLADLSADLSAALGMPAETALLMPAIKLR
jgi:protease IV